MEEIDTSRKRTIIRAGIVGVVANILLAAFKAIVGLAAHSIAIVMDALNNLSDAGSSTVTIIGAKLAARKPDREHPFGHGRYEYVSAFVVAVLILYAGIAALVESVKKIISPSAPDYSAATLIVVSTAVLVKIFLGFYCRRKGRETDSDALSNSGGDALMDAVISFATLVSAVIFMIWRISLDAWLAAVISLLIIKVGIDMLHETISRLLGERVDKSMAEKIRSAALSYPEVKGVYDIVLSNYGPDKYYGSLHIEVPDTLSVAEIDVLSRKISSKVYCDYGVILTAVGIYSKVTEEGIQAETEKRIRDFCLGVKGVLEVHAFFMDEKAKKIRFDVVISFDAPDRSAVYEEVSSGVRQMYPDYCFEIVMDSDYTDICK